MGKKLNIKICFTNLLLVFHKYVAAGGKVEHPSVKYQCTCMRMWVHTVISVLQQFAILKDVDLLHGYPLV